MNTLNIFRKVGFWEGISFLVLATNMVLKRMLDYPDLTYVIGMAHGVLFIGFCILLAKLWMNGKFTFMESFWSFLASLFPFGTFIADAKIWKRKLG